MSDQTKSRPPNRTEDLTNTMSLLKHSVQLFLMTSDYLSKIIDQEKGITPLQVVFCDVESYSQRKTVTQADVVSALTASLKGALDEIAARHADFASSKGVDLHNDTIVIPTGDGAAIAFPFAGQPGLHLDFARTLLRKSAEQLEEACAMFDEFGWCDCHSYFNLRIGLSQDNGIVYRDVNDHFNAAGVVINIASRIMDTAGRNEILITEEAYQSLAQFIRDSALLARFTEPIEVLIKREIRKLVRKFREDVGDTPARHISTCRINQRLRGSLETRGDVILESGCQFEGELIAGGRVTIEEGARFLGDLRSKALQVDGNLNCGLAETGLCLIRPTGCVLGDLMFTRIVVNEGGTFIGKHGVLSKPPV